MALLTGLPWEMQPAHAGHLQDGPVAVVGAVAVQAGYLQQAATQADAALVVEVQMAVHQPARPRCQL